MIVNGKPQRTIWPEEDGLSVGIIDQTLLPHRFETVTLRTLGDAARAISEMWVRGAPLIGATGAYGLALALRENHSDEGLDKAFKVLNATRPTAVNLGWALARVRDHVAPLAPFMRAEAAWTLAGEIADEDVRLCSAIGDHGKALIDAAFRVKMERVNILTHCNAGWLATVDWGTALAPIYKAYDAGVPVHVFVDETRPRNQGAFLTAWELGQHGVPHTVIADNSGGHLMQHGLVDLCIVGTDRTTANGDVANKIGTYLKALAAHDNRVPFYVAAPSPSIDFSLKEGIREIPIEQRSADEVIYITGKDRHGALHRVQLTPDGSPARNDAFDVTPARLVTGLITERGVTAATEAAIAAMFPDKTKTAPA